MNEFLRDPIWQAIGAFIAIIGLIATLVVFYLQRPRKSLGYSVLANSQLVTINDTMQGRIQVLYDGIVVKNSRFFSINLFNNGNISILPSDFEKGITFSFGEHAKIFVAEISDKKPDSLEPIITVSGNKIILDPLLLNSKDQLTLKIIGSEFESLRVTSRIAGVQGIESFVATTGETPRVNWLSMIMPPGIFSGGLLMLSLAVGEINWLLVSPMLLVSFGIPLATLISYVQNRKRHIERVANRKAN